MDYLTGNLAKSKAGRDKGRIFIILDVIDENYVYIADGSLRKVEKPKKKKVKHLYLYDISISEIEEKIKSNVKLTNSDIKKAIEKIEDPNS